jgi:predicted unusual protein kinase regulating ubiquinone biosynthesis (AarF/ABC1/UbiB family)
MVTIDADVVTALTCSCKNFVANICTLLCVCADPHPGNVAVDAEGGGRLIYYDFGMMGSIPGGVRGGLMELFYGVYERDADRWAVKHSLTKFDQG